MLFLNTFLRNNSSYSTHKLIINSFKMSVRACSTVKTKKSKSELENERKPNLDFKPIFKFPYINLLSSLNRLKIYQSALTVVSLPIVYFLEASNVLPTSTTLIFSAIGFSGVITLSIFSLFTTNIIGILYYNEKEEKVRISYLDFVGNRKDVIFDIEDIVPFSEMPRKQSKYYSTIQFYEVEQKPWQKPYILIHKLGGIMDTEAFGRIFGED